MALWIVIENLCPIPEHMRARRRVAGPSWQNRCLYDRGRFHNHSLCCRTVVDAQAVTFGITPAEDLIGPRVGVCRLKARVRKVTSQI
jgi:hypothetical protein